MYGRTAVDLKREVHAGDGRRRVTVSLVTSITWNGPSHAMSLSRHTIARDPKSNVLAAVESGVCSDLFAVRTCRRAFCIDSS